MVWFLKIGLILIITSLVLELLFGFTKPITYTDKTRKLDDIWMTIFGSSISLGVISCLIWFCGLIITTPLVI